jgi:hypothetical protein
MPVVRRCISSRDGQLGGARVHPLVAARDEGQQAGREARAVDEQVPQQAPVVGDDPLRERVDAAERGHAAEVQRERPARRRALWAQPRERGHHARRRAVDDRLKAAVGLLDHVRDARARPLPPALEGHGVVVLRARLDVVQADPEAPAGALELLDELL